MDHTQPFNKRITDTTSEDKFEQYCLGKDILYYKYGIDDHPFGSKLYKINRTIRNTPDYIVMKNNTIFMEVKGCKDSVGIKLKDIESYDFWNKLMDVYYFIYSTTYNYLVIVQQFQLAFQLLSP